LLVASGGAIGSVLRWWMSGAVQRAASGVFPWGTFAVNAAGSFTIGLVATLALDRALVPPAVRIFLIVGVLGGFTTFSAFSYETLALLRDGQWATALGYASGSVLVCVAAAFAGYAAAGRL
jgi:CrcB protein